MKNIILLISFLMLLVACSVRHPLADRLKNVFMEYGIHDYNCLIVDSSRNFEKKDYREQTNFGCDWMEQFVLPMLVINEVEKGTLCEDSILDCYMPVRDIHNCVLLKDIIRIPENLPELFPKTNGDASFYLKQLARNQLPDTYEAFYKRTLKIDKNQRWNTLSVLTAIKRISSYFDERNITGYLSVGKGIPDLYPTWYAENIYQLAGWYVFRINKHVVLWNALTDGSHIVICLKFIDLQRTVAVVFPFRGELLPFDAKGNPDLLLSPLTLAVLQETFGRSDDSKVNYNTTKSEICLQLKRQLSSPYIALYIKELQARIKQAKTSGKQQERQKLVEVYDTLFAHSLPVECLSETSLAAVNYVSDHLSASRHITLDTASAVRIFYSIQKRKYISVGKDKIDSVVITDRCLIENRETGEKVWTPRVLGTSVLPIEVEMCDTVLPSGRYVVRYESDGRHSFESWLSPVPAIDDYGIRIYKKCNIKREME